MQRSLNGVRMGTIAVGLVALLLTPHAFDTAAATDAGASALEEIVVTSRRREESLQDVPDAIVSFSAQAIEDAGISTFRDFSELVPNMTFVQAQNQGTNSINIRGIGQVRNGEPPVAVLFDGVQIASPNQITQELFDVERIEVLKGPQGALYGRNAIGGAINIMTREPSNEYEHTLGVKLANGRDRRIQGISSGPLVEDRLFYRIAGSWRDFDGVIRNVTLDEKVDFVEDRSVRGRLLFHATDRLSIDARLYYADFDGGAAWYIPVADGDARDTSTPVEANILGVGDRTLQEYALKVDYEADLATLTAITAYSRTEEGFFEDLDWLSDPILAAEQILDVEAWSQELRLTSPSDQTLRWMVGGYYLETDRLIDTRLFLDLVDDFLLIANPADDNRNRASAAFSQISYDLTDRLELTAALRYDRDRRRQTSLATGDTFHETFDAWQPKLSLAYGLTDDAMVYATVARGFRSGGFNQVGERFEPLYEAETTWNYELGFKTAWNRNRLQLNGAVFWTDFDNQHVFLLDAETAAQGIVNIRETRIRGAELDIRARPIPSLELTAGVGLMDAEIRDFDGTTLYRGNQSPLVNEWSYNLSVQHMLDLGGNSTLVSRIDYSAKGDLAWHVNNEEWQQTHHLVDVRLGIEFGERWRVTAFARNLFNEKYSEEFFSREFIGTVADIRWPNTPRRYGIEATLRF